MANDISTRPYLIRAIYEWCVDGALTPYLAVVVDKRCRVPMEYVREGEIVLNIAPAATPNLTIDNEWVSFNARFSGVSRDVLVPVSRVMGIYAKENGQGLFFGKEDMQEEAQDSEAGDGSDGSGDGAPSPQKRGKPTLRVVK